MKDRTEEAIKLIKERKLDPADSRNVIVLKGDLLFEKEEIQYLKDEN